MKECPSCGAEVPTSAPRCKECFHDFTEEPPRRNLSGPLLLLASFAGMAVVGAATLFIVVSRPLEERILVDEDTRSVVWTKRYRSSVETDRLMWDEIIKLEYVIRPNGSFEVVAVTVDGDRRVIHQDQSPLKSEATHYAKLMEKPLEEVDKTSGFNRVD